MSKLAFFTDEDVYAAIAAGLRKAGLDAISTPEAGRHHAGIVVSSQRPIGDMLGRLRQSFGGIPEAFAGILQLEQQHQIMTPGNLENWMRRSGRFCHRL